MRSTCKMLATLFLLYVPCSVMADGGTVRLSQQQSNYQITVLTAPTPVRAGPIDISVLIQKAGTQELVLDGQVAIKATRRGHPGQTISHVATTESATNKLFRAANFRLPRPGWWDVEVSIDGPLGNALARFEMEAAEPLPAWVTMWPWFAWPALAICLFGIHELVVNSKRVKRLSVGALSF